MTTRQEFEDSIRGSLYSQIYSGGTTDIYNALFHNDKTAIDAYNTNYLRANERIAYWLAQYDLDPDTAINTFDNSLGSASVDPLTAINWPPTNGVFAQPLQANWTQSNNTLLDYIKNKPSLSTVATTGSYNDLSNKPTIPAVQVNSDWSASSGVAQILNKPALTFTTPTFSSSTSATQLSSTRSAQVLYTYPTSLTSLLANQSLTATLQIADDSGFTTNVATVNSDVQGCSGILSLTLTGRLQVQGIIPAGKYRRVVLSQSGGATVPTTLSSGQEVLL